MANAARPVTIMSWNFRGLGDKDKCGDVRLALPNPPPDIACLQETKLQCIDRFKVASFLPRPLASSFVFTPSVGASGGILTAWNHNTFKLLMDPPQAGLPKAFDSVAWDALDMILATKGFPDMWRRWIHLLNISSQTAVALNGVPGRWFSCKKAYGRGIPCPLPLHPRGRPPATNDPPGLPPR
jgi:hypothetical protein